MAKRSPQTDFFKKISPAYGGDLLKKRKGRIHGRPISTQHSMHIVLKSTLARREWSFLKHKEQIRKIVEGFGAKYGVRLNSMANVGNHLHFHLQLTNRHTYKAFIRAISAAIMMAVTGASRWRSFAEILKAKGFPKNTKFWERRPFSRIIIGFKALLTMRDYIQINKYEEWGYSREDAKFMVAWDRGRT
jgi:REP element-mobilizing transposase RayT